MKIYQVLNRCGYAAGIELTNPQALFNDLLDVKNYIEYICSINEVFNKTDFKIKVVSEIKFNQREFDKQIKSLVGCRRSKIKDIEALIEDKTNLKISLVLSDNNKTDKKEGYDERLVSNCTLNGEDLCYLDIYFLKDNSNQYYITEVSTDFNT